MSENKSLEQAAKDYADKFGSFHQIPGLSKTLDRAFKAGASYQLQNSVSKEHYDELKLNYERLNERERKLVEALQEVSDAYEKPTSETRFKVALYKAKQVLSNHKK